MPLHRVLMARLLAVCLAMLAAAALAEAPPAPIRVGSVADYPPYAQTDEQGRPTGFSVDLMQAVAREMGLPLALSTGTWDSRWQGLLSGQLDVLPFVARAPGRDKQVYFGVVHTETFDAFFVRRGSPAIEDLTGARGKRIVIMRNDAAHHELLARGFKHSVLNNAA